LSRYSFVDGVNIVDSGQLTKEVLDEMGIKKKLPRKVEEAWQYLDRDREIVDMLGEEFVKSYISVKKVR
jgi:glutamine synthetase